MPETKLELPQINIPADPYTTAITSATIAIAKAVEADILLDIKLIEINPEYAEVVIEERTRRKQFLDPIMDFFAKLRGDN
jgi:hypothetical protein